MVKGNHQFFTCFGGLEGPINLDCIIDIYRENEHGFQMNRTLQPLPGLLLIADMQCDMPGGEAQGGAQK